MNKNNIINLDLHEILGVFIVQPQNTQTQNGDSMVMLGCLGCLGLLRKREKGGESTFLNIPATLRPTYFLHFFIGILF